MIECDASLLFISSKRTRIINKNGYILKLRKVVVIKGFYINIILKVLLRITGF